MKGELGVGTSFAGRYLIRGLLGRGGMATVYRAADSVARRDVALKLLQRELLADLSVMARFQREARAASRIDHVNVTKIYDFGHAEDGTPYLAMELAEGPTLAAALAAEGPFEQRRALAVLLQIAAALEAAHLVGVVHRDIKPDNVVLHPQQGAEERVKVLDFGLAKIFGQERTVSLTATGLAFGTPAYMAPEQALRAAGGEPPDHRADIYSFGIVAFELLVGRVPFAGEVVEVLEAQVYQHPPAPSQAAGRALPAAVDELVLRCLAKRPAERYASAVELRRAIGAIG